MRRMNSAVLLIFLVILAFLLVLYVKSKNYSSDNPVILQVKSNFSKINPEYGKIPIREGNNSYTENKSAITLCITDPDTGKYYSMNTIMYVALHELSHIISKTYGHNEEFKRNFVILLKIATEKGLYDPSLPMPPSYCGISN